MAYGRYRLEIEDPETGLKVVYPFAAGWTDGRTLVKRPDQIEMKLDKAAYRAGDIAKVTLIPPEAGEAVVAVEGDGILWRRNIQLEKKGGEVEILISPEWQRHDLYVSVVAFRPTDSKAKISPNRTLGLIYLPLDRSDRALDLEITAPNKVLPEKPVTITVNSEQLRDQTAILTLAAVDVGVLNITRFKTPDPFAFYFSQRKYVTNIHDMYGKIIETAEGQTLQQRFGGGAARQGGSSARAEVQVVSLFNAATRFDKEGQAQVEFMLPGFDGKLRLMAVAIGEERLGSAEAEMQVASPVVASLSGPRFLTTGDHSWATLELNNTTEQEQTVHVTLNSNELLNIQAIDKDFTLAAGIKHTVRLPLKTAHYFGVGALNLKLTGQTPEETFVANRAINIALRPAYPARYDSYHYELPAQGEALLPEKLVQPFLSSGLQARLTLSSSPTLPVSSAIQGLLQYPYGCLEQTVSRAYPYLFLEADDTERWGLTALTQKERNSHLQQALIRLNGMQLGSGAFTLWGNYGLPEQWLTAYVADFLLDAKQQGFTVPERMLERSLSYLEQYLQKGYNGRYPDPFISKPAQSRFAARTYAAYVLAREKRAVLGSLRVMHEKEVKHAANGLPLVQLGLALILQGDKSRGNELITQGLQTQRDPDLYLGDYGSVLRDQSMLLSLLLKHKHTVPELGKQVLRLSRSLQKRSYLSTQEKVFIFLLGRALIQQSDKPWQAQLTLENITLDLRKQGTLTQRLRSQNFINDIKIVSQSEKPLYVSLVLDGYPKQAPAALEEPLSIRRDWFSLNDGSQVKPEKIKAGDLLLTRLQIKSQENIRSALVVDLLPAGFELENTNLSANGDLQGVKLQGMDQPVLQLIAEQQPDYQAFRDDRYLASLKLRASSVYQLFYLVRVIAKGKVAVPPSYVEDMYRPDIHGIGTSIGILDIQ